MNTMIRSSICLATIGLAVASAQEPLRKLTAVPFTDVKIADHFWAPRQETNRLVSIPVSFENLEKSGQLESLRLAAQHATNAPHAHFFKDSDVYKSIEAASYSLANHPDAALEKQIDDIIAVIAAAQQPDGYLNSYFIVNHPDQRWTNLRDWHELYCAGHLFEAAVAHFRATGKTNLLAVAIKFADHIDSRFGPPPKLMGYPGHPEVELALIKLWRVTGERRYFELAKFFVENRGTGYFSKEHGGPNPRVDLRYWQDDVPIKEHDRIKGHAVRATYLMSGVTDVARETDDPALLAMLNRVWDNTTECNMYVTGGIGPSAHNEGFTSDYDLPNPTAYQETCATIALGQWNHRLALLYGDAKYADVLERALYNGAIAGVSQDGRKFFYVNPLESAGTHHRKEWFSCACCPPNVARTLAFLGGYVAATGDRSLYVNLFIAGSINAPVADENVTLDVATDYPWDGKVTFKPRLSKAANFDLCLRIPGWCEGATVSVNRDEVSRPKIERGYCVLSREWKNGDTVQLNLPMPIQRIAANPRVQADQGLLAIERGPLVYCLEQCDQSAPLASIILPANDSLKPEKEPKLLNGIVVLKGFGQSGSGLSWTNRLYQQVRVVNTKRVPITAIPYYAWDNRGPGPMKVWLPATAF